MKEYQVKDIDLTESLFINWHRTEYDDSVEPTLFLKETDKTEADVMAVFHSSWNIVYRKVDDSHYLVRFNSREDFENFKKYAFALSASDYIFEGDVQHLFSNFQCYGNMVELRLLGSFDITNTLARILSIRTD